MSSIPQITANQKNSLLSTGPISAAGKAISSLNAAKHGIFAQSDVLPNEDPAELAALDRDYHDSFKPQGPIESKLVEILIRADWLTKRYDRIEPAVVRISIDQTKSPDDAVAELFARTRNNPLTHLYRRRQSAQRDWFRALKELERLRKARKAAEPAVADPAAAEPPIGFVPANAPASTEAPAPSPAAPEIAR